jgi:aminopeptidase N
MKFILVLFALCLSLFSQAQHQHSNLCRHTKNQLQRFSTNPDNARSDSADILHYHIELNITDFVTNQINGSCNVTLISKISLNSLDFDLQGFTVDSVKLNTQAIAFSHQNNLLNCNFGTILAPNDTHDIQIFYRGSPAQDPSGWGGFYFQSGYAFNLGVGFDVDPHGFGRAWFPCFDNFVERSSYSFSITTPSSKSAHCNGVLTRDTVINTLRTRDWYLEEPIPTYLACVAVADYATVRQNYSGTLGNIPIELVARAADTSAVKTQFATLDDAMECFEYWYGPYRWSKIGYSMVPFNSGAMEHATNITYPRSAAIAPGSNDLMAHELSHHWWGNLATCETDGDMWLNEGMASYSEHLYTEWVSGRQAFVDAVVANRITVINNTHLQEGGYRAVSGLPHEYVYGRHVYDKGALVAHNLRGYLGDSLFRVGLHAVTDQVQFTHHNSAEFRDRLSAATGYDLTDFFANWVFEPGFAVFEIDSFHQTAGNTEVFVEQKLRGTNLMHQRVPLEFSFQDPSGNWHSRMGQVSGHISTLSFNLGFTPQRVVLNRSNYLNLSRAEEERTISAAGSNNMQRAKFNLTAQQVPSPTWVRIEHYYAAPDDNNLPQGITRMSNGRYWNVDADFPAGFKCIVNLEYNGNSGNSFLDLDLLGTSEDSLFLLWRPSASEPWSIYPHYTKNMFGNNTNRQGFLLMDSLLTGQFALGNGDPLLSALTNSEKPHTQDWKIYPNPSDDVLIIQTMESFNSLDISILSLDGKVLRQESGRNQEVQINVHDLPEGSYIVRLKTKQWSDSKLFYIRH